jgi:hypothetical protein
VLDIQASIVQKSIPGPEKKALKSYTLAFNTPIILQTGGTI